MHIRRKQWYKDQWDKEVFKTGQVAHHYGKPLTANPYDIDMAPIDHALWILGWSYADRVENPDTTY